MRTSTRGIMAVTIAVAVVVAAGIVGASAPTEPDELACEWVAVSANGNDRT